MRKFTKMVLGSPRNMGGCDIRHRIASQEVLKMIEVRGSGRAAPIISRHDPASSPLRAVMARWKAAKRRKNAAHGASRGWERKKSAQHGDLARKSPTQRPALSTRIFLSPLRGLAEPCAAGPRLAPKEPYTSSAAGDLRV
jgi:hypothetical protein